ncbi:ATP-dependent nuclease [Psychrobacter aquimaris]|uniref:ATP-dependent nuclease n=1 Tax=Pseudomonadati TaxID=3379134 RepID=UPI003F986793
MSHVEMREISSLSEPILQIRFPYFKKITPGTCIQFENSLTVLVGPNGSGKTSVLQALYGCPNKKSVGDFWFSTSIDPFLHGENDIHRFIYKYKPAGLTEEVEVLKNRTKRKNSRTGIDNPDYWEPAKPKISDNMLHMPATITPRSSHHRTNTRWNAVSKEVVYIDFRAEISAFDKCFHFGHYNKTTKIDSIQDFIRARSSALKPGIDKSSQGHTWHSRKIKEIKEVTEIQLEWINKILNKEYSSATIVTHDFFGSMSNTIIFREATGQYSEAMAGSGEVAATNCVIKVTEAKKGSIILLDEPEVSLHPGAQSELRNLLLDKIRTSGCQVIISTHSPSFVEGLPKTAIKLFYKNKATGTYSVLNESTPEQVFLRIGIKNTSKTTIFVEDRLAKLVVEEVLKEIDSQALSNFDVYQSPGGAKNIIKHYCLDYYLHANQNSFVLLDGDEKPEISPIQSSSISEAEEENLDDIIKNHTKVCGSSFQLPINTSQGMRESSQVKEQKIKMKKGILDAFYNHFKFMNIDTPEELIWKISDHPLITNEDYSNIENYKSNFERVAKKINDDADSTFIYKIQEGALAKRNINSTIWLDFKEDIKRQFQITEQQD